MKIPELPPLPEPLLETNGDVFGHENVEGFTADQLRDYALAYGALVREECAKEIREVAESLHGAVNYFSHGSPISERDCWMLEQAEKLDGIAAAIREQK